MNTKNSTVIFDKCEVAQLNDLFIDLLNSILESDSMFELNDELKLTIQLLHQMAGSNERMLNVDSSTADSLEKLLKVRLEMNRTGSELAKDLLTMSEYYAIESRMTKAELAIMKLFFNHEVKNQFLNFKIRTNNP